MTILMSADDHLQVVCLEEGYQSALSKERTVSATFLVSVKVTLLVLALFPQSGRNGIVPEDLIESEHLPRGFFAGRQ